MLSVEALLFLNVTSLDQNTNESCKTGLLCYFLDYCDIRPNNGCSNGGLISVSALTVIMDLVAPKDDPRGVYVCEWGEEGGGCIDIDYTVY